MPFWRAYSAAVSYTHLDVYKRQVENRQGNDCGSQYQTGIYYTNESAKETVERLAELERGRSEKFFVEVGPLKNY